jgi:hypothetical protein
VTIGHFGNLSASDAELIRACLAAAVDGPFFPESEFATLMGLSRPEVAAVLSAWPETSDPATQELAVNNVLNNLLGYPHGELEAWAERIPASPAEVAALFSRLRSDDTGRYFDRMM